MGPELAWGLGGCVAVSEGACEWAGRRRGRWWMDRTRGPLPVGPARVAPGLRSRSQSRRSWRSCLPMEGGSPLEGACVGRTLLSRWVSRLKRSRCLRLGRGGSRARSRRPRRRRARLASELRPTPMPAAPSASQASGSAFERDWPRERRRLTSGPARRRAALWQRGSLRGGGAGSLAPAEIAAGSAGAGAHCVAAHCAGAVTNANASASCWADSKR